MDCVTVKKVNQRNARDGAPVGVEEMTLLWQCEKQVDSCGNGGEGGCGEQDETHRSRISHCRRSSFMLPLLRERYETADEAPCPLRSGHLGTCCGNQSQPFLAVAHRNPLKLLGTLIRTESNLMSSLSPGYVALGVYPHS
ncbi:hypothetical protein PO909_033302 [Leuciscus waleckii]